MAPPWTLADGRDLRPEGQSHAHAVVGGVDELQPEETPQRRADDRVAQNGLQIGRHQANPPGAS